MRISFLVSAQWHQWLKINWIYNSKLALSKVNKSIQIKMINLSRFIFVFSDFSDFNTFVQPNNSILNYENNIKTKLHQQSSSPEYVRRICYSHNDS